MVKIQIMLTNQALLIMNANPDYVMDIALAMTAQGAKVLLCYPQHFTDFVKLEKHIKSLDSTSHITLCTADMQCENGVDELFDMINDNNIKLTGIINLLPESVENHKYDILEMTLDDWNQALDQTLHPLFLLARRAIDEFVTNRIPGRIINFWINQSTHNQQTIYEFTFETALHAFCRSVAKEYGRRNISCNTVMLSIAKIKEIISTFLPFLLKEDSSYITGETIDLR